MSWFKSQVAFYIFLPLKKVAFLVFTYFVSPITMDAVLKSVKSPTEWIKF